LHKPTFSAAIESIATRPLVEWAASFAARIETWDAVQLCNMPLTRTLMRQKCADQEDIAQTDFLSRH
jgi:hypothetical protein